MKWYACIDLKSFYASVECVERGLDPLSTYLLVADASRTEKTICLAVSPPLKACGVSGRARLFEAVQAVRVVNAARAACAPGRRLTGETHDQPTLERDPSLALSYIVAPPRMATYIAYSARVYEVYLRHVAPEDIHVYSVDEVFMDLTPYLKANGLTPAQFVSRMVRDVYEETGVTATAGIGTNLYLAKVAMDILAKHAAPDAYGVRVATLTEQSYRRALWNHRPLTDFWRIGRGTARRLEVYRLYTMGDVARFSLRHEELLYRAFGVNAELIVDHAWGIEPCTLADIKAYRPTVNSLSSGQVLTRPYSVNEARLIVKEMAQGMALDLVDKRLLTDHVVLDIGYDRESLLDPLRREVYTGEVVTDAYGRAVPRGAHGTERVEPTSSGKELTTAAVTLYDCLVNTALQVRRLTITAGHVVPEQAVSRATPTQLSLFADVYAADEARRIGRERERRMQEAMLDIRRRYGKGAVFRAMDLQEEATALERSRQIGGHKA